MKIKKGNEEQKLRIAMFTNNYFPFIGGVPISIDRVAKSLERKGHTVYIFAPEYPQLDSNEVEPNVIRCSLIKYWETKYFNFLVTNIFDPKIEAEFCKLNFDIIHVHHPLWMGAKGLKLGQKYNIPVVFTYHTQFDKYTHYMPVFQKTFQKKFVHKMTQKFANKSTQIIAPTESSKNYLETIDIVKPINVIPTGLEKNFYALSPKKKIDEKIRLCSVSRIVKEKNIFFLIEGIKKIKEKTTTLFSVDIIGDGPEMNEVKELIRKYNLEDIIIMRGEVKPEKIKDEYLNSDLFIFSSLSETQGMVLLEAMSNFCPVVAINSNGIDDVVVNDFNGYKTADDLEEWSERICELIVNREKINQLGENAHSFSLNYEMDKLVEKFIQVYDNALDTN